MVQNSLRVVGALVQRDLKVISTGLIDRLINYALFMFFQSVVFGYLMPYMGMPPRFVSPIFVGSIIFAMTGVCFSRSLSIISDIHFGHHIQYELGLPIHRSWLIIRYVISLMIEFFILSAPLLFVGKLFLGSLLDLSHLQALPLIALYLCDLFFLATFFLSLTLVCDFHWFIDNLWPRVLSPLELFGCVFYTWQGVYKMLPRVAQVLYFNPIVLLVEGLRSTILSPEDFIPAGQCFVLLLGWGIVCLVGAFIGLSRRLDPV